VKKKHCSFENLATAFLHKSRRWSRVLCVNFVIMETMIELNYICASYTNVNACFVLLNILKRRIFKRCVSNQTENQSLGSLTGTDRVQPLGECRKGLSKQHANGGSRTRLSSSCRHKITPLHSRGQLVNGGSAKEKGARIGRRAVY
jgi:hypothetical protein